MSRGLLTGGAGFFSRLASVRFLSVTRVVRGIEESRTRVLEGPGTTDVREVQSTRGASTVAADLDQIVESRNHIIVCDCHCDTPFGYQRRFGLPSAPPRAPGSADWLQQNEAGFVDIDVN